MKKLTNTELLIWQKAEEICDYYDEISGFKNKDKSMLTFTIPTEKDWIEYYNKLNAKIQSDINQINKNLIEIAKGIGALQAKVELFEGLE